MGNRLYGRLAIALAASLLASGQSFGEAVPADASLSLFENLLSDANSVPANLAYAQSLQASGRIDDAKAIYRRVLGIDPTNPVATAALAALGTTAEPAHTDYTLRWGGAYESNSPRRPPDFSGNAGGVAFGEFTVNDTRQLDGVTYQSNFDIYSNIHTKFPSVDISYAAVDVGPIVDLESWGKLRIALGGELLFQGSIVDPPNGGHGTRKFTYDAGDVIFNYFPATKSPLQSVNVLVGYDNFTHDQSFRSGVVFRTISPLLFNEVTPFHTQLIVAPGFIYNGADNPLDTTPRPARYAETDLDVLSLTPLADQQLGASSIVGKLGVFFDAQWYDTHDPALSSDRRDQRVIPIVGVRLLNMFNTGVQVDLDYRYDRNFSNDASERFEDHIVSLTGTYRF